MISGKSSEVLNLEEKIARYEREIGRNTNNIVEITELIVSKAKLSLTVEEFGRCMAIKSDLLDKMSSAIDSLNQEKLAFKNQVEEFEKEIGLLKENISVPRWLPSWNTYLLFQQSYLLLKFFYLILEG